MERLTDKKTITIAVVLVSMLLGGLLVSNVFISRHELSAFKQASAARAAKGTLKQRFAILSSQHSNKCSLASVDLDKIAVHGRLQGSCCSRMSFDRYVEQVHGLTAYTAVPEVPPDPYDVPVGLAKQLIAYDGSVQLSPAEQAIYDQATKLSNEHGPCCCHCWRWKTFEGQAKQLIARRRYGATQIAHLWDLEDGCGSA